MKPSLRDVNQFFRQWLALQNKHDYTRYARLYALDFSGVKRTHGGRKQSFKRTAWLSDRRLMLSPSRHLHLTAENVRLHTEEGAALVTFDQYFRTKNYGDWGPKLLRLRAGRAGLQIVHEEMLASYALPPEDCC